MSQNMDETKKMPEKKALLMNTQELSEEALFLEELRQLAGMETPAQEQPRQKPEAPQARQTPQRPAEPTVEQRQTPLNPTEPAKQPRQAAARERRAAEPEKSTRAGFWKGFALVGASTVVLLMTILGVLLGIHTPM